MIATIAAVVALAAIAALLVFFVLRARWPKSWVRLSHLQCPKCGAGFDYAWVPGVSFTAIRLGRSRSFACPVCGQWSVFDIWDTKVDPETHHCDIRIGPS